MKGFIQTYFLGCALCLCSSIGVFAQSEGLQIYRHVFVGIDTFSDTAYCNIEVELAPIQLADTAVQKTISSFVLHTVASHLASEETISEEQDLLSACVSFENACKNSREVGVVWSWDYWGSSTIIFSSPAVYSVELDEESYTGGAHGMHSQSIYNFNPANAEQIDLLDFVEDTVALKQKAEAAFWKMKDETFGKEVLNEEFFWSGEFYLPENIGFLDDGLLILYNEYEAAAYVYGPLYVILPYQELKGVLRKEFLPE